MKKLREQLGETYNLRLRNMYEIRFTSGNGRRCVERITTQRKNKKEAVELARGLFDVKRLEDIKRIGFVWTEEAA
jgi:hypothetical protein